MKYLISSLAAAALLVSCASVPQKEFDDATALRKRASRYEQVKTYENESFNVAEENYTKADDIIKEKRKMNKNYTIKREVRKEEYANSKRNTSVEIICLPKGYIVNKFSQLKDLKLYKLSSKYIENETELEDWKTEFKWENMEVINEDELCLIMDETQEFKYTNMYASCDASDKRLSMSITSESSNGTNTTLKNEFFE